MKTEDYVFEKNGKIMGFRSSCHNASVIYHQRWDWGRGGYECTKCGWGCKVNLVETGGQKK